MLQKLLQPDVSLGGGNLIKLLQVFLSIPNWQQDQESALHRMRDVTDALHLLDWIILLSWGSS